ncbi:MAG: Yip1 family protein [Candidatus Velthaea sp.]
MSLVERVKNITFRPNAEWPVIAGEPSSLGGLYTGYVAPLAAINPIALFIGLSIIGVSIPFMGTYRAPFFSGISQAVLSFVMVLVGLLLMAAIVNALAPTFGGRKNLNAAFKLVAYSATPGFVAGVLSLFPPLAMLELLAALWGLYLFYVGIPVVMQTTRDKALPYTALSMVCAFVIGFVLSIMIGTVMGVVGFATGGFGHQAVGAVVPGADEAQAKAVAATIIGNAMGGNDSDKQQAAKMIDGVAQAGKAADAAAASGDTDAQAAAGVGVLKSLVSGGKGDVKTIPRETLKTLLPDSVAGLPRSTAQSSSGSFAGIAASGASAVYGDDKSGTIELSVGDMGNMGGLALIANLGANLTSTDSDEGYTKTVEIDGRKVHEQWTVAGKKSEVFEIIDNRYAVSASGSGVAMDTTLQALGSVDVARFTQLQP